MLVLAGGVGVVLVVRPGPVAGWLRGSPSGSSAPAGVDPAVDPAPEPVLAAAAQAPAPTPAGVTAAIDRLVRRAGLGGRFSVSVVDGSTGQSLYARGPHVPTVPASTTKLVTAATVLAARGPAYRIVTRAVTGGAPGEVVLVGGGDPTLAGTGRGSYPDAARLDALARQVKRSLGGTAPRKVVVDSSLFTGSAYGPGWDADLPTSGFVGPITALMTNGGRVNPKQTSPAERFRAPDLAAGQAFAKLLGLPPGAVRAVTRGKAPAARGTGAATASPAPNPTQPGGELGKLQSPPLLRMVEVMLAESDNVLAEALARQVALAKGQPASYAGTAAAMDAVLDELGLPAQESALVDGSGLSRRNRLTPALLTALLAVAAKGENPELSGILSGLPVAGWSGTLADRFAAPSGTGKAGVGVVRAKTGTLSAVDAMSGVVHTASGRLLVFALLASDVPVGHPEAQAALDAIAAALARCGCR